MTPRKPKACQVCGKERELSQQGLCSECGFARWKESMEQIRARKGPHYDRWLRGIGSSLGLRKGQ